MYFYDGFPVDERRPWVLRQSAFLTVNAQSAARLVGWNERKNTVTEGNFMSKTYGKKKNSSGWDFRRKVIAAVALVMAAFFVLTMASQIFMYAFAF